MPPDPARPQHEHLELVETLEGELLDIGRGLDRIQTALLAVIAVDVAVLVRRTAC